MLRLLGDVWKISSTEAAFRLPKGIKLCCVHDWPVKVECEMFSFAEALARFLSSREYLTRRPLFSILTSPWWQNYLNNAAHEGFSSTSNDTHSWLCGQHFFFFFLLYLGKHFLLYWCLPKAKLNRNIKWRNELIIKLFWLVFRLFEAKVSFPLLFPEYFFKVM